MQSQSIYFQPPKYFPRAGAPHPSRRLFGGQDSAQAAGGLRPEEGPCPLLLRTSTEHGWVKRNSTKRPQLGELPSGKKDERALSWRRRICPLLSGGALLGRGPGTPLSQHPGVSGRRVPARVVSGDRKLLSTLDLLSLFSSPFIGARCRVCSSEAWGRRGGWLPAPTQPRVCVCLPVHPLLAASSGPAACCVQQLPVKSVSLSSKELMAVLGSGKTRSSARLRLAGAGGRQGCRQGRGQGEPWHTRAHTHTHRWNRLGLGLNLHAQASSKLLRFGKRLQRRRGCDGFPTGS